MGPVEGVVHHPNNFPVQAKLRKAKSLPAHLRPDYLSESFEDSAPEQEINASVMEPSYRPPAPPNSDEDE